VIVFTLWATVVAVADLVYGSSLNLSNSVVPLLSVVVGLMLVFRNTTAFARWEDGRKAFTSMQSSVRNTARDFWISIGAPIHNPSARDSHSSPTLSPHEIRLKARALRLLVAYVTAVKRHVRGQYGIDYEDLRALLPPEFYNRPSQPGFGFDAADADIRGSSSSSRPLLTTESPKPLSGALREPTVSSNTLASDASEATTARSSPKQPMPVYQRLTSFFFSQKEELGQAITADSVGVSEDDERSPLLRHRPSDQRLEDSSVVVVHNYLSRPSLPLPLVISHQLHLYITRCKRKGFLESIGPAGHNRLVASISTLNDLFSAIDGLGLSKIPACYCIHLKQCTSLYLWALPLTLASGKPCGSTL
jgi:putative membrane protein